MKASRVLPKFHPSPIWSIKVLEVIESSNATDPVSLMTFPLSNFSSKSIAKESEFLINALIISKTKNILLLILYNIILLFNNL